MGGGRPGRQDVWHRRALAWRAGLVMTLVTSVLVASAPPSAAGGGRPDARGLEAAIREVAGAGLVVQRAGSGGAVTFLGGPRPLTPPGDGDPSEVAKAFVDRNAPLFGADGDGSTLVPLETAAIDDGGAAVRFQQEVDGIPVLAGQLVVRVDDDGAVRSSAGEALPDTTVDTTPTITADAAAATAIAETVRQEGVDAASLTAAPPELWVYDPSLIGAPGLQTVRLVWRTDVRTPMGEIDRLVLVDARSGVVALSFSQVHAVDSQVCNSGTTVRSNYAQAACGPPSGLTIVKSDSINLSIDPEVLSAYALSKGVLAFYAALGRNSVDDAGTALLSTVHFCYGGCSYANAFWNGAQMVYGPSYASADDVVGHELTHGVTQYESQLLYYSESGAINESLSDVFGELFDQWYDGLSDNDSPAAKWYLGEDLPDGAVRYMADPSAAPFFDPDRMTSSNYWASPGDEYGVHINSGVNNKAAFLITDGGTFNSQTITGLGTSKAAWIYYEAQTSLLTPGSDYRDLSVALPQACANLVGSHGITSGDCASVTKAVTATEMNLDPTVPGGRLRTGDCPSGQVRQTTLYSNDMEAETGWTSSSTTPAYAWAYTNDSSQSGSTSMWATDPVTANQSTVTMTSTVTVPAADTYVRFDHSFSFDSVGDPPTAFYDGGQVLYSANGAAFANITGIAGVAAVNGYNGTLQTGFGNAIQGQQAFVGNSPGYQQSRYKIGALNGQTFRLRFLLSTDTTVGAPGWEIDDVEIYTCVTVAAPGAPTGVVATAGDGTASLTWTAPASNGGSAITEYVITPTANGVAGTPISTGSSTTSYTAGSLTNGVSYTFTVAAKNAIGTGAASAPTAAVVPKAPTFTATSPKRVFDTRPGESPSALRSVPKVPVSPGAPLQVHVAGLPGGLTPDSGVGAVSLNVAVANAATGGYVTVYPCGNVPFVASVNYGARQVVSNAVMASVSAGGDICVYASSAVDVIVDLNGWFPTGAAYTAVVPARVFDTRPGESPNALRSVAKVPVTSGSPVDVQVTDLGGLTPSSGVGAVALNVAVTNPAAAGYITVYPCADRKLVASVNYAARQTVSNAVIAPVSATGHVCFATSAPTDLIVDIDGWFPTGNSYHAVGPERVFDTRPGESPAALRTVPKVRVDPATPLQVHLADLPGGVTPASGIGAVSFNVAVTNPVADGFITVYPCGTRDLVASVNYTAGQTVSNAVIAPVSSGGDVCFYASATTDLIVDINGWFPAT